jgi:hypothetical protein
MVESATVCMPPQTIFNMLRGGLIPPPISKNGIFLGFLISYGWSSPRPKESGKSHYIMKEYFHDESSSRALTELLALTAAENVNKCHSSIIII